MKGRKPLDGPLSMWLTASFGVPASWPRARRTQALAGEIVPVSRPDLDNIIKVVMDALNHICWHDDAVVVQIAARKVYSETPRLVVEVEPAILELNARTVGLG